MKTLVALSFAGVTALSGCAVYPAVGAGVYIESAPPPVVVVRPHEGPRHYHRGYQGRRDRRW